MGLDLCVDCPILFSFFSFFSFLYPTWDSLFLFGVIVAVSACTSEGGGQSREAWDSKKEVGRRYMRPLFNSIRCVGTKWLMAHGLWLDG